MEVPLRYALVFLALAAALLSLAVRQVGAWGWGVAGLAYPALSFMVIGMAYAGLGPRVFRKRADGGAHRFSRLVMAPYSLLNLLTLTLFRWIDRDPAYARVTSNLWFGRKLTGREARELVEIGCHAVLDLAAEFTETPALRRLARYRALGVLDATPPTREQFDAAVAWLREATASGPAFVHCALGHGRTASIVIAFLFASGEVESIEGGLERLRESRRGVGMNERQAKALREWIAHCGKSAMTGPHAGAL